MLAQGSRYINLIEAFFNVFQSIIHYTMNIDCIFLFYWEDGCEHWWQTQQSSKVLGQM